MATTIYIVPADTSQAGQCRIVSYQGQVKSARDSYRAEPGCWQEAGLMNSSGKLVCLKGELGAAAWDELKSCEPLMAGMQFEVAVKL